ncbi:DUF3293 domain-containing protein [Agarivorans sp. OAG1]|uniref:DUF3293 domain-containing protein n=1 Tax=Agarivorans sp. OAG1 TaxID=3082387 RepID=UPI0030CC1851
MFNLYQNTIFLANTDFKYQELAVITASNPDGVTRTRRFNHWLDCHFISFLQRHQFRHFWVFAGSRDLNHYEYSAIVDCSLIDAQHIAKAFRQKAFYWLDNECYLYDTKRLASAHSSLGEISPRWFNNPWAYNKMIEDYHYARSTTGTVRLISNSS